MNYFKRILDDSRWELCGICQTVVSCSGGLIAHDSKVTVTYHFIESEFKLHSNVYEAISIPERHTSLNLAIHLTEIAKCWGIENEVACVVITYPNNRCGGKYKNNEFY